MKAFAFTLVLLAGCTYDASFTDCTVACSAAAPSCPEGFSCSMSEGMCRAAGAGGISCAAVLDGGQADARPSTDGSMSVDANPVCEVCDPLTGDGCGASKVCGLGSVSGGAAP